MAGLIHRTVHVTITSGDMNLGNSDTTTFVYVPEATEIQAVDYET